MASVAMTTLKIPGPVSSAKLKTIKEVQFGIFSPEEIKGFSVCHVQYPETLDDTRTRPRENGLGDTRMGSIDRNFECASCNEQMQNCQGHFGHIELVAPVFHPGFIKKTKQLLECVCHTCGKILVDETLPAYAEALKHRLPKTRFNVIHKLCEKKTSCESSKSDEDPDANQSMSDLKKAAVGHGGCGNAHPNIVKVQLDLKATWKRKKSDVEEGEAKEETRFISPRECQEIFSRITDADLRTLGFSLNYARPEWMILTVLPVPPPPVRPGVSMDGSSGSSRSEDDLTYKLGDIIRANQQLRRCEQEGSPQHVVDEFFKLLQYHVATLMDNQIAGVPQATQKSGRALKSIRARLKGKEGRLRGNLMGKRVNFSARTVITGDPNLSLDEVGVPRSIAQILTFPEVVTPFNIQRLLGYVRTGPYKHPGARYITRETGDRLDLKHQKNLDTISLGWGWIVERHIMDGDYIVFNRQPSLHKESMMGHRVRVLPFSTFRLNLSVTSPYNADFDGDEMNLHVPQTQETRAEIQNICMVPLNIVSPQRNGALMGIVQDSLCGIYKMARRDVYLTKEEVMSILMWVPEWDGTLPRPAFIKPRARWTGKQLISLLFPPRLNLQGEAKKPSPIHIDDEGYLIQQGELVYGLPNKKIVGVGSSVIHTIYNQEGWEACMNFFNGCQRIVNYWLLHNGFSIGIGDTVPDPTTIQAISNAITSKKEEVAQVTKEATANELEPLPGMSVRDTFESKVQKALNDAREKAGADTADNLKDINNAVQMSRSGSKGSNINISQMTALVGQQAVEGKRVPFGFSYRTLPHFTKDDYSPESRGFVENSYLRGLVPTEFFFHAMAGREGLIDTAVKTAETGYIQRRLVKALEDCSVKYDGTVRNSLGDIVQFVYGEDGMDAQHIEEQTADIIYCSEAQFADMYRIDVMDPELPSIRPEILEQAQEISGDLEVQRHLDEEWERLQGARQLFRDTFFAFLNKGSEGEKFQLPLHIERIIQSAQTRFNIKSGGRSDLNPKEVIPQVQDMLERLVVVRGSDPLTLEAQHNATLLFKALLQTRLAFKRLVATYSLTKLALNSVLGEIENKFLKAQVNPGEMVGVLAAQSIGEPATQMTLNTFHFTGIASKNVTLGVPRLKEILNAADNLKTPSMLIYLDGDEQFSQDAAKKLRSTVEHTSLRSVTESSEIWYDPDVKQTVIEADEDMVESYWVVPDEKDEQTIEQQGKWVLRILLGRRKLLDKGLTVSDVATKLKEEFGGSMAIIFSDNNADEQVIRIRLISEDGKKQEDDEDDESDSMLIKVEEHLMSETTIRGIPDVSRAFIEKHNIVRTDASGQIHDTKDDPLCQTWRLNTSGTALRQVFEIEGVDVRRTYTNNFLEVVTVLGIEAGRAAMATELYQVLSFDGSYVNARHLAILADVMTSRGKVMPVTRHGINRAETGAIMRCSFEETVEILLDAANLGELDNCRGISENIVLGQLAPLGTGDMEIIVDEQMISTVAADNQQYQGPGGADGSAFQPGSATPYDIGSPQYNNSTGGPDYGSSFSPIAQAGLTEGSFSEYGQMTSYGGTGALSPYQPTSPYSSTSPAYNVRSPFGMASPAYGSASPAYSPSSPGGSLLYGSTSPASPAYTPGSPGARSTSPSYSPTSPSFSPTSPGGALGKTSPGYSPTSPGLSPKSPGGQQVSRFSPKSPYSPTSPAYSPASPMFNASTVQKSPTSPAYSPTSPHYSPTSPAMLGNSPTSPSYSPTSPQYSPTSPQYKAPGLTNR
ncbi:RNA polymerase II largest subunit [Microthyrium microscopicum]|uniref:DNA-directed RNA polymerase subunit n=1 Tax=Microthyrium microscopicum TaxID=703497 RepID=A0A6A6U8G1_9PEZI|nr:RNA polymerase II largest subunit [Microthyrium microscopicum]